MKATTLLILLLISVPACRPPEPVSKPTQQAVSEASEEKGFRLSPQAIRALGIETIPMQKNKPAEFPASALVYYQAEVGIYRLREGWFRLIPLDHLDELSPDDSVAIRGAGFLRVTDISLFGEHQSGHHH